MNIITSGIILTSKAISSVRYISCFKIERSCINIHTIIISVGHVGDVWTTDERTCEFIAVLISVGHIGNVVATDGRAGEVVAEVVSVGHIGNVGSTNW